MDGRRVGSNKPIAGTLEPCLPLTSKLNLMAHFKRISQSGRTYGCDPMMRGPSAVYAVAMLLAGASSCSIRANFEGQPVPRSSEAVPLALSPAALSDPSLKFDYPPIISLSEFEEVLTQGWLKRCKTDSIRLSRSLDRPERARAQRDERDRVSRP
jgi:hypothetical protein